jgi:hypothetical protein
MKYNITKPVHPKISLGRIGIRALRISGFSIRESVYRIINANIHSVWIEIQPSKESVYRIINANIHSGWIANIAEQVRLARPEGAISP